MYELTMWVCLLSGACMEPLDLLGPYKTKEECIERALSMSEVIRPQVDGNHTFAFKCVRSKEQ